jgi:hypothetical protein
VWQFAGWFVQPAGITRHAVDVHEIDAGFGHVLLTPLHITSQLHDVPHDTLWHDS